MTLLILGLILFLGAHTFTTLRLQREQAIARLGEGGYKGLYSLVAFAGLILIIWGFIRYRASGYIPVWEPPRGMTHLTITLMWFSFVALAASSKAPGKIRGWLRHPMLVGVKIWALAHLLANGDLGSIILFGALLAWAVYDRIAVKRRGDIGAPRLGSFTRADAIAVIAGTVLWGAMIFLHPYLIGVPVLTR